MVRHPFCFATELWEQVRRACADCGNFYYEYGCSSISPVAVKMRKKQTFPQKIGPKKRRAYALDALERAYQQCVQKKMSVRRASIIYGVPMTTLRDRMLGKVDHATAVFGSSPLFTKEQEKKLAKHFNTMADLGYGYTQSECVNIASDYACQLGKRARDNPLTIKWMTGFMRRWPELKNLKPRGLEYARARMASESVVRSFFENLKKTMDDHDFYSKPHLIYNVDEKGVSVDHKPPNIVASASYCPQAVTSGKGKTVTMIGAISASGSSVPPYFIFPGKRMNPELLQGKSPGAGASMSESGWCNASVFRDYLTSHFLKHVPGGRNGEKVLVLLDGHKSHVSVGLCEWARERDIVLFILPAHTSHILQPLDVACYGPFQRMYNSECHKIIKSTAATINKYNVCEIACKVYTKALSAENSRSGFKRTGIFPFNRSAVPAEYLIPAEVYHPEEATEDCSQETVPGGVSVEEPDEEQPDDLSFFQQKEMQLKKIKNENERKPRKTMSKIVSGTEISSSIIEKMKEHEKSQGKTLKKKEKSRKCEKLEKSKPIPSKPKPPSDPQPGPSHINLAIDTDSDSLTESDDDELCCVCNKLMPESVAKNSALVLLNWAQCDGIKNGFPCKHWVHLKYCTNVRVIRLGDKFYCPHC